MAAGIALVFAVLASGWSGSIKAPSGVGVAVIAWGMTMFGAAWQQFKAAQDTLQAEYGEIHRIRDAGGSEFFQPFLIVMTASGVSALFGLVGVLIIDALSRPLLIAYLAVLLAFCLYDIFGLFSLVGLVRWSQRKQQELLALKEELEARKYDDQETPPEP